MTHNRVGRLARYGLVTGLAAVSFGAAATGTSSASQAPTAATYKAIVAHFDQIAAQTKAPSPSALTSSVNSTAKALVAVHWKGRTNADVKAEAKDLTTALPVLLASDKDANFKPNAKQQAIGVKLITDATQVRKDLGLAANNDGI